MIPLLFMLAGQTVSGKMPPAQALPPPTGEEQAVLNSASALLASFASGSPEEVLRWVYPDGRVTGTGKLPNRSGVRSESWTQFTQRLGNTPFQETISDPAVEVDGDAAMVWAPFVVRIGGKVSNCGVDHFDLVREDGAWKVMNLTFSSRISGCPEQ
jgi:hypothetical protein